MIENNNTEQSSYQATYAPKFVKMKGVVRFVCLLVLSVTMLTAGNAKVPSQAPPVCAYSCPVHAWVESLPHPVGANGVVKVEAHGSLYHLCPEAEVNVMLDANGEVLTVTLSGCEPIGNVGAVELATISAYNESVKNVYQIKLSGGAVIIVLVDE